MRLEPSLRVQLHSHSTVSDGFLERPALIELYRDLGYHAIAITDHDFVWHDKIKLTKEQVFRALSGAALPTIAGEEAGMNSQDGRHLVEVGLISDAFDQRPGMVFTSGVRVCAFGTCYYNDPNLRFTTDWQQRLDWVSQQGGLAFAAHPGAGQAADWPLGELCELKGLAGLEVSRDAPGEVWDRVLTAGAMRLGFATDDHDLERGQVQVDRSSSAPLLDKLRSGRFVSLYGHRVLDLEVDDSSTSHAPSATAHRGALHLVFRRDDNNLYWKTMDAERRWSATACIPRCFTRDAPTLVSHGDRLYVFFKAMDRARVFFKCLEPGGQWPAGEPVLVPECRMPEYARPAVASFRGQLHLLYQRAEDLQVVLRAMDERGGWSAVLASLPNPGVYVEPALAAVGDNLHVFAPARRRSRPGLTPRWIFERRIAHWVFRGSRFGALAIVPGCVTEGLLSAQGGGEPLTLGFIDPRGFGRRWVSLLDAAAPAPRAWSAPRLLLDDAARVAYAGHRLRTDAVSPGACVAAFDDGLFDLAASAGSCVRYRALLTGVGWSPSPGPVLESLQVDDAATTATLEFHGASRAWCITSRGRVELTLIERSGFRYPHHRAAYTPALEDAYVRFELEDEHGDRLFTQPLRVKRALVPRGAPGPAVPPGEPPAREPGGPPRASGRAGRRGEAARAPQGPR